MQGFPFASYSSDSFLTTESADFCNSLCAMHMPAAMAMKIVKQREKFSCVLATFPRKTVAMMMNNAIKMIFNIDTPGNRICEGAPYVYSSLGNYRCQILK